MKNDIQKNLTNNFNFNYLNNISSFPMNINLFEGGKNRIMKEFKEQKKDYVLEKFGILVLNCGT